jgi:hypothetical protein
MSAVKKSVPPRVSKSVKVSLVAELSFGEQARIESMPNLLNKLSHPMSYLYDWFPFVGKIYDGKMEFPLDIEHPQNEKITFKSLLKAVDKFRDDFKGNYTTDQDEENASDEEYFNYLNSEIVLDFLKLFSEFSKTTKDFMINMNVINHQIYLEDKVQEDNSYNDIIFLRTRYARDDNVDIYIIRQMMKFMENKVTLEECTLNNRSYFFEGIESVNIHDYVVYEVSWGS